MKRIVVTGALGYVGSALIQRLSQTFPSVHLSLVDDLSSGSASALHSLPATALFTLEQSNLLDLDLEAVVRGADALIHLAAQADPEHSHLRQQDLQNRNIECTERILDCCEKFRVPWVFPSSTSVYGIEGHDLDETVSFECLAPQTAYAASKLECEKRILERFSKRSHPGIIFRWASIFGLAPVLHERTAIHKLCSQALRREPLTVWETALDQKRPYAALEDVLRSIHHVLQTSLFDGRIYNVASFHATPRDIIREIENHLGPQTITRVKSKAMSGVSYTLSTKRLTSQGIQPQGSLAKDLAKLLRSWPNCSTPPR